MPTVTAVNPAAGPLAGGTSVALTGTQFAPGATVLFGLTPAASVIVNSATSITAVAPAGSAGTVDITVTAIGGTSAINAPADQFTYVDVPTVTAVSPVAGPIAGGTSVTLTGTNFVAPATVSFGGTAGTAIIVNNATTITVTAPAHAVGTVDITVTTPGGTSAVNAPADQYTYAAVPTVTSVSPNLGPIAGGTSVTIAGANYSGTGFSVTAVTFGGTAATSFIVNNSTSITAVAPAHASGVTDVRVTTVGGQSTVVAADQFTYWGTPTISLVNPNAGPIGGGTSVTLTGTQFAPGATVLFGLTPAASVIVNSATSITAVAPAGSAGTVDITVTTIGGTSTIVAADQFTYASTPTVTAVSPLAGPIAGGTSVTLTGTNFFAPATVSFGGTAGTAITVNNATTITVTAPAHAVGTVDITVTTGAGTSATSAADQYTYFNGTMNWTGTTSTDWGTSTNWSPAGVPTANDDVIIGNSAPPNQPTLATTTTVKSVTINGKSSFGTRGGCLTINTGMTLTIAGNLAINGSTSSSGTGTTCNGSVRDGINASAANTSLTVGGNVTLTNATVVLEQPYIQLGTGTLTIAGNYTKGTNATFTAGTGAVVFNGAGAQTLGGSTATFTDLTINKSAGAATLLVAETVAGNLTVSSGTLDLSTFTANRSSAGGTLSVANGATLKIGGTNSIPTLYSTHTLGTTSTVEYSGTAQTVSAESYGSLTLSGSGNKTSAGAASVAGDFTRQRLGRLRPLEHPHVHRQRRDPDDRRDGLGHDPVQRADRQQEQRRADPGQERQRGGRPDPDPGHRHHRPQHPDRRRDRLGRQLGELRQRPPPEAGRHRPLQPAVRDRDRVDLCPGQPGHHRRQRGRQPDRVVDRERPSPAGQLGHRPRQHHRPLLDPGRGRRPDRHELQRDVHLRQPR